jgi:hypothetical protein
VDPAHYFLGQLLPNPAAVKVYHNVIKKGTFIQGFDVTLSKSNFFIRKSHYNGRL